MPVSLTRRTLLLGAALVLAGRWQAAAAQAEEDERIHVVVAAVDAGARRIRTKEREYALAAGAVVQWQGGRRADLGAVRPGDRVTLQLVPGTAGAPVPVVAALTLPVQ